MTAIRMGPEPGLGRFAFKIVGILVSGRAPGAAAGRPRWRPAPRAQDRDRDRPGPPAARNCQRRRATIRTPRCCGSADSERRAAFTSIMMVDPRPARPGPPDAVTRKAVTRLVTRVRPRRPGRPAGGRAGHPVALRHHGHGLAPRLRVPVSGSSGFKGCRRLGRGRAG
jgi:hypothetical protein